MAEASQWLTLKRDKSIRARLAAIVEPFTIILAATLAARFLLDRLGVADADEFLFERAAPDFLAAARSEGIWHVLRYGLVILLAVAIGWWRGRRSATSYGVTLGGHSLARLAGIGAALGLLVSIPVQLLQIVHAHVPLGADTPFWELRNRVPWTPEFWVYMAVGSYLVVPLLEELMARGYVLGRLRESYSPAAALLLMAAFFALAHGQYHRLDVMAVGLLLSLMLLSVMLGFSVYRTGSLVPAIVAHAIVNMPLTLPFRYAALAIALTALILLRRQVADWLRSLGRLIREADDWLPALAALGLIAVALLTLRAAPWAPYAWLALFLVITAAGLRIRSPWADAGSRAR